jgi:hypothetical protein
MIFSIKKSLQLVLISSTLAVFCSCCQTFDKKTTIEEEIKENPYLGKWYSVKRIYPFGAVLKIDSNYNFIYEGGYCIQHFSSKGSWTLSGDTLILNSFEPERCYNLNEFCVVGGTFINLDSNEVEILSRQTSIKRCEPDAEYEYIVFKQEKFIIEDSVLTYIRKPDDLWISERFKNNFTKTKE